MLKLKAVYDHDPLATIHISSIVELEIEVKISRT
jgi:hypothetical protein